MTEEPGGFAAGGVALVVVHLDYRAGVELRPVIAVVLVGVVRVHRVGIVGGDQQGMADGALEVVLVRQHTAQDLLEERAVRAA